MDTSEEAASVDHLLAHNHPPSAADLALVLRGINSLQDEISDVKGEIAFWTSRLSKLEGRLDQHLGIASAMRRMPEEILAQVFLAYPFEVSMTRAAREELVQLMLVCRSWRNAALTAHQLWATIFVDGVDAASLSYDKAAAWLDRAANAPRALVIRMVRTEDCPSYCSSEFTFGSPCILSRSHSLARLLSEGPSLHYLDVQVRHRRCMENFVKTLSKGKGGKAHPGPSTLRLKVMLDERGSDYTFLSSFPTLTGIRQDGIRGINALVSAGCLELLTLLSFSIGRAGDDPESATLPALSKCDNLKELYLTIFATCEGSFGAQTMVSLRKVTFLRVAFSRGHYKSKGIAILNHINLPALHTLEIIDARDATVPQVWEHFFQRHISIRVFRSSGTVGAPLHAAFNHLPLATHFTMGNEATAIAWLLSRFRRSVLQNEAWFPRLEHLELLEVEQHADLQYLFDFVLTRRSGRDKTSSPGGLEVTDMKSVTVEFVTRKQSAPLVGRVDRLVRSSEVQTLRESGMNVTISSYREPDPQTQQAIQEF